MFQLLNLIVSVLLMGVMFAGLPWGEIMHAREPGLPPDFDTSNLLLIGVGGSLYFLWWLGTLVPQIAVSIRRLHDRDISGWWYGGVVLASFIPLVNILAAVGYLVLLVIYFLPGTDGPNRFGPDPKDPGQASVFA